MVPLRSVPWLSAAVCSLLSFSGASFAAGLPELIFIGEGTLRDGDAETAKHEALSKALSAAREKTDAAVIEDLLSNPDPAGAWYFRIIDEQGDADRYRVRLGATFVPRGPGAPATTSACPVMVVVQEVLARRGKRTAVDNSGLIAAELEHLLLENGFTIVGRKIATDLCRESPSAYQRWSNQRDRVLTTARNSGADLLIIGRVVIEDKGRIENAAFAALNGQTRIEVQSAFRGFHVASGQLFSTRPDQISSMGINLERAMRRAMRGRGRNFIERVFRPLLDDLHAGCGAAARGGNTLEVVLEGMSSYRRQGRPFEALLARLPGVGTVEGQFNGDRLNIGLTCDCSAGDLVQTLLVGLVDTPPASGLRDLDVVSVGRNKLVVTF